MCLYGSHCVHSDVARPPHAYRAAKPRGHVLGTDPGAMRQTGPARTLGPRGGAPKMFKIPKFYTLNFYFLASVCSAPAKFLKYYSFCAMKILKTSTGAIVGDNLQSK